MEPLTRIMSLVRLVRPAFRPLVFMKRQVGNEQRRNETGRVLVPFFAGGVASLAVSPQDLERTSHIPPKESLRDLELSEENIQNTGLDILLANNVPVPPNLLLLEYSWDEILQSPFLHHHDQLREELREHRRDVEDHLESNTNVPAEIARTIHQKILIALQAQALEHTLSLPSEQRLYVNAVLEEFDEEHSPLDDNHKHYQYFENKAKKIKRLYEAGKYNEAAETARRACNLLREFMSILRQFQQIWKRDLEKREDARNGYLLYSGAFMVLAVSLGWVKPERKTEALVGGSCLTALALCASAREWWASQECKDHLDMMAKLNLKYKKFVYSFERTIENCYDLQSGYDDSFQDNTDEVDTDVE
eukprot:m.27331 g.27331  ORF g.27331 m.27331 type:complete len:362 (+) comp13923_c0_seq1:141-1226(+)